MSTANTPKLAMGPVLFNWKPEVWRDFHFRIADEAPIDTVYVGEVVCSKRSPFYLPHIADVVERLLAADKKVILSTLALIMNKREMDSVREIAADDDLMVEANDVSAVALLKGKPHAIGPFVNVYNEGTLDYLVRNGASRICLPVELSADSIGALSKNSDVELEVQVFGRLPLAVSARCYHARTHNLAKDNCQFVCDKDLDGLDLDTMDGEPFLAVNGIQTMSYTYCNMIGDVDLLKESGVKHFRLSPHTGDMVKVAKAFQGVISGKISAEEADDAIAQEINDMPISNGYLHGKEGVLLEGALAE